VRDPLEELEAAGRMLVLEAKALRDLKAQAPKALGEQRRKLLEAADAARTLVSELYALEVALRRSLGEDNSAEALRRELSL